MHIKNSRSNITLRPDKLKKVNFSALTVTRQDEQALEIANYSDIEMVKCPAVETESIKISYRKFIGRLCIDS